MQHLSLRFAVLCLVVMALTARGLGALISVLLSLYADLPNCVAAFRVGGRSGCATRWRLRGAGRVPGAGAGVSGLGGGGSNLGQDGYRVSALTLLCHAAPPTLVICAVFARPGMVLCGLVCLLTTLGLVQSVAAGLVVVNVCGCQGCCVVLDCKVKASASWNCGWSAVACGSAAALLSCWPILVGDVNQRLNDVLGDVQDAIPGSKEG